MGAFSDFLKGLFGGGDSSSNNSTNRKNFNTGTSTGSGSVSADINASLKRKYKRVDAKNKLQGVLFTGLINDVNEVIDDANTKKENTKIQ